MILIGLALGSLFLEPEKKCCGQACTHPLTARKTIA